MPIFRTFWDTIDVENFISHQDLFDASELNILLKEFADIINSLPLGALAVVSIWGGSNIFKQSYFS